MNEKHHVQPQDEEVENERLREQVLQWSEEVARHHVQVYQKQVEEEENERHFVQLFSQWSEEVKEQGLQPFRLQTLVGVVLLQRSSSFWVCETSSGLLLVQLQQEDGRRNQRQ